MITLYIRWRRREKHIRTFSSKRLNIRLLGMPVHTASYTNPFNIELEGLEQNHLAEDCEHRWSLVNLTINLRVP
jgi:hypothetical protein